MTATTNWNPAPPATPDTTEQTRKNHNGQICLSFNPDWANGDWHLNLADIRLVWFFRTY